MKFTLEIELGNDAMSDRMDVAGALERVSHALAAAPGTSEQGIRDLNGATVGRWRFSEDTSVITAPCADCGASFTVSRIAWDLARDNKFEHVCDQCSNDRLLAEEGR